MAASPSLKSVQASSQAAIDAYVMDKALRDSGKGSMWIPSCRLIVVEMADGSHRIKCADGIIDRIKALFGWGGYSFNFERICEVADKLDLNILKKPSATAASFRDVKAKWDEGRDQSYRIWNVVRDIVQKIEQRISLEGSQQSQTPSKIRELLASTQAAEVTFDGLVNKSIEVYKAAVPAARNLTANKITSVGKTSELKAEIVENAKKVRPILHEKVVVLCKGFLAFKSIHGTVEEQALYKGMKVEDFIERLMTKRPMMFMTASDSYLLRNGRSGVGGFDTGAHGLNDYISYEEIEIAALIGMSVPTHFVNKGDRNNSGKEGPPASFAERGVYQALVGARFELPTQMESKYMLISASQNTQANGYGKEGVQKAGLDHWKKFYGVDHFASFEEAKNDKTGRFIPVGAAYLDTQVYRARMKATIEVSLLDANRQGEIAGQKAYIHAVGIGIGVWAKNADVQARIMVDLYREVIREKQLPYVGDIDFSWFPGAIIKCGEAQNGQVIEDGENTIKIHFSKRNPADPVPKDRLLIAQYAWDGNSFPGNEYWQGMLAASGDPAAASCSTISELQTPQINEAAAKKIVVVS